MNRNQDNDRDHAEVLESLHDSPQQRSEIVLLSSKMGLAVTHTYRKPSFSEAPYSSAYFDSARGRWVATRTYHDTPEGALLNAMGLKALGPNNQFGHFAEKMLRKEET